MNKRKYNFERVIRRFVKIDCQTCSNQRGVQNEHDKIECGRCGATQ